VEIRAELALVAQGVEIAVRREDEPAEDPARPGLADGQVLAVLEGAEELDLDVLGDVT
jgi:hypothetical protein